METIKVTLPDGTYIEGTPQRVIDIAKALGVTLDLSRTHYNSGSKGLIPIKEMQTTHLRNAILKMYEEWVVNLHSVKNPQELCRKMQNGIIDMTWEAMVLEYFTRKEV